MSLSSACRIRCRPEVEEGRLGHLDDRTDQESLHSAESTGEKLVKVGFAAESEDLLENAQAKLVGKGLHLIAANDITSPGSGFTVDTSKMVLLNREGGVEKLPLMSKYDVDCHLLDRVERLLGVDGAEMA